MSVKQHLVTAEELLEMPDIPGKQVELVNGKVVEMSPAGGVHTRIMFRLAQRLDAFVGQNDLGEVMPDSLGYVLRRDPDQVRVPDVSFIAAAQVPPEGVPAGFWEGAPTLAVEVVSPNDRAIDVRAKVQNYLEAGTRQVWVLWPDQRAMTVHDADLGVRELGPDATLDGGEILPGFGVTVGDLFEVKCGR